MQRYVPNFPTMFSSLRHYPRQGVTLDTTDPVPAHISRQWRGYTEQARETLIRYKKLVSIHFLKISCSSFFIYYYGSLSLSLSLSLRFNYDPLVTLPPKHYSEPEVDGKNRYRYFRRPIIPFLPQMPPNVVLAPTRYVNNK